MSTPTLQDLTTGTAHPIGGTSFVVGRNPSADLSVTDPGCSRAQFRIVRVASGYVIENLSATAPTFCDGRPVTEPTPLRDGATIRAGGLSFRFVLPRAVPPRTPTAPRPPVREESTVLARPGEEGLVAPALSAGAVLVGGVVTIGRDATNRLPLPHPQVSRRHAVVTAAAGRVTIRDLGSANGTFLNGVRVPTAATPINPGDDIDIGPYALEYDGRSLVPRSRADNVELVARNLRRTVTDAQTRKPLTLLDDISLVIRPREFVCLLGPSGSGKSTLMGLLSGRTTPDDGTVLLNGQDLHACFDAVKGDIAFVPQRDLLHMTLSVGQILWYTARLRLPPDTSAGETEEVIADTLKTVQLGQRRGTVVQNLSGGQVKRTSLANELLCKPSLLFLDEVTSGLDERTDRDMMQLFRSLADAGKTVVCVTHSLAHVEASCTLVVILTAGGKLAFVGPPADAARYFGVPKLGDVYAKLEERKAEEWQSAFRASPYYRQYVTDRLPADRPPPPAAAAPRTNKQKLRVFFRQTQLLVARYCAVWRGTPSALLTMAGQPLLVAILLVAVFGDVTRFDNPATKAARTESLLFLLAVTCFWFGCNNAAKELVKERGIFTRERDYNLISGSYYLSKVLVLALFGLAQTALLYGLVKGVCGPPGSHAAQFAYLAGLAVAGTALGLLLSAVSPTEEVAVSLIPIAIIPQVVLAAGVAPLSGAALWLARLGVTTYWGKRGLDSTLPDDMATIARTAELAEESAPWTAVLFMALHAMLFVTAAQVVLAAQGRAAARLLSQLKKTVR